MLRLVACGNFRWSGRHSRLALLRMKEEIRKLSTHSSPRRNSDNIHTTKPPAILAKGPAIATHNSQACSLQEAVLQRRDLMLGGADLHHDVASSGRAPLYLELPESRIGDALVCDLPRIRLHYDLIELYLIFLGDFVEVCLYCKFAERFARCLLLMN